MPPSTSNTTTLGSMSNISSAVSSRKHDISLPPGVMTNLGRTALKQTQIQKTDAGQTSREALRYARASGISLAVATKAAEKSAARLTTGSLYDNAKDVLLSNGLFASKTKLDLMNHGDVMAIFREIDKFGKNYNLGHLSRMSKGKLQDLMSQYQNNKDISTILSFTISLKGHHRNLNKIQVAKLQRRNALFQLGREGVKDVDSLNFGLSIYDTAYSIKQTKKAIKEILKKAKARKAINNPSSAKVMAKPLANNALGRNVGRNVAKNAAKNTARKTTRVVTKRATKTILGTSKKIVVKKVIRVPFTKTIFTKLGAVKFAPKTPIGWIIAAIAFLVLLATVLIMTLTSSLTVNNGFFKKDDGETATVVEESIAGIMYEALKEKDFLWIEDLKDFKAHHTPQKDLEETLYGFYNPTTGSTHIVTEWANTELKWFNGDKEELEVVSNTKEILSAATVFVQYDFVGLKETYKIYSQTLWEDTHTYELFPSSPHTCASGCGTYSYKCNNASACSNVARATVVSGSARSYSPTGCYFCSTWYCAGCKTRTCSSCGTDPCPGHSYCPGHPCSVNKSSSHCPGHCSGHTISYCLGHVDVKIEATINNITETTNTIFAVDSIGAKTGEDLSLTTDKPHEYYDWDGWNESYIEMVEIMANSDWASLYGIGEGDDSDFSFSPVNESVESYDTIIEINAIQYGITEYKDLIKAIMMYESGGEGNDPMHASEFEYNKDYPKEPNGITSVDYSITVGVHQLADCLKLANVQSPTDIDNIKLALQGYNLGTDYITWAIENYGGYSLANATAYATAKMLYNPSNTHVDGQYAVEVLKYYTGTKGNQSIVSTALSQVGNVNGEPYWSWYGFKERVAWCACFVSWCANEEGLIESGTITKFAYCPTGAQWFKDKGLWKSRNYEPKAGDIIFFDWEGDGETDHVGIVSKTANGTVYTVEGNSKNECKQKQYPVGSSCIYGYGTPAY